MHLAEEEAASANRQEGIGSRRGRERDGGEEVGGGGRGDGDGVPGGKSVSNKGENGVKARRLIMLGLDVPSASCRIKNPHDAVAAVHGASSS